jgi:hypothetical protein
MPNRRPRPKRSGLAGLWLFLLGALAGAGILYLACDFRGPSREEKSAKQEAGQDKAPSPRREPPGKPKPPRSAGSETPEPAPSGIPEPSVTPSRTPPAEGTPLSHPLRVALVID